MTTLDVNLPPPPALAHRAVVVAYLREVLPGRNLYELARGHGVIVRKQGRLNKGWAGQTLEKVAGLTAGNAQRRDGEDFELKSTSLVPEGSSWASKETIKITQVTPKAMLEEDFETSVFWNKLQSLILVGCFHESDSVCKVVRVSDIDITDPDLVAGLRRFWEEVQHTLAEGEMANFMYPGTARDLVQLRPTGDGRQRSTCPITGITFPAQAFYGTKPLISRILSL